MRQLVRTATKAACESAWLRSSSLALELAGAGCSPTWTHRAIVAGGDAAILCDLSQTLWMADGGRFDHGLEEANPLLGRQPSTGAIVAANLGAIAVNTALYFVLPRRWGLAVNAGVLLGEGWNVATQPSHTDGVGRLTPYANRHHGCDVERKLR